MIYCEECKAIHTMYLREDPHIYLVREDNLGRVREESTKYSSAPIKSKYFCKVRGHDEEAKLVKYKDNVNMPSRRHNRKIDEVGKLFRDGSIYLHSLTATELLLIKEVFGL